MQGKGGEKVWSFAGCILLNVFSMAQMMNTIRFVVWTDAPCFLLPIHSYIYVHTDTISIIISIDNFFFF